MKNERKDTPVSMKNQPAVPFAQRFVKRHGELHCAHCLAELKSNQRLPHVCGDARTWGAR